MREVEMKNGDKLYAFAIAALKRGDDSDAASCLEGAAEKYWPPCSGNRACGTYGCQNAVLCGEHRRERIQKLFDEAQKEAEG